MFMEYIPKRGESQREGAGTGGRHTDGRGARTVTCAHSGTTELEAGSRLSALGAEHGKAEHGGLHVLRLVLPHKGPVCA